MAFHQPTQDSPHSFPRTVAGKGLPRIRRACRHKTAVPDDQPTGGKKAGLDESLVQINSSDEKPFRYVRSRHNLRNSSSTLLKEKGVVGWKTTTTTSIPWGRRPLFLRKASRSHRFKRFRRTAWGTPCRRTMQPKRECLFPLGKAKRVNSLLRIGFAL